jgi:DNA replication protein DnaC
MAQALDSVLKEAELGKEGYIAFLEKLIARQIQGRTGRSLQRRIKKARFPQYMTFETFDWTFQPSLNVEYVKDLTRLEFIENCQPVLILGKCGVGKSHLAVAFGIRACEAGYKCEFYTLQDLLTILYATLADDTTYDTIARFTRLDLLIIDAIGYVRAKPEYPSLLLDLVSACQHSTALMLTSNISFQQWGETLGNTSITNAIVDRLFDRAHLININPGRSYRTQGPHAPTPLQTGSNEHP